MVFPSLLSSGEVKDIGGSKLESLIRPNLVQTIQSGQDIPKEVFYIRGPWDEVSMESYKTSSEECIFKQNASKLIAKAHGQECLVIFDLEAGILKKAKILLDVLETMETSCHYFPVDINLESLKKQIPKLDRSYKYIRCAGLWGTFDDALGVATDISKEKPTISHACSFGSTLSNSPRADAINNSRAWDCGFMTADDILNRPVFNDPMWSRQCAVDVRPSRHTFHVMARKPTGDIPQSFKTFTSFKYTKAEVREMASEADLTVVETYGDLDTKMRLYDFVGSKAV
ncbi:hypothetical protein B0T10DRAFT_585025 [Thelonectria olida]|uniref:Histidine-specific methyltransferase SAM-dependent domain-containing protein n=1 Tax=Thelonectria olida TaxID=1576542 RepID=A0A9P8VSW2_9HYPO|nr:hypothetical protein B0T10DRAFT_585025 [Thelonectria olida]